MSVSKNKMAHAEALRRREGRSGRFGHGAGAMASAIPADYPAMLADIKARIRSAQVKATLSVNRELIQLYWDIGRVITQRQAREGWGAGVIPRLARDIRNELPEVKGFSERNIGYMIRFAREYAEFPILQQPVAKLPGRGKVLRTAGPSVAADGRMIWLIPWGHNIFLMEKIADLPTRLWYMRQSLANGWSRNVLDVMIDTQAHLRQGKAVSNFERLLPPPQSDMAQQSLKDPYIFDFLTLEESFHERELETQLLRYLQDFLIELGRGFAFVGRQYHLDIGDQDFYIDLLFYHLHLRAFVVIELKKGEFRPEYAGKMNFYLSAADELLRREGDAPSIGLILCQDKKRIIAEYALRGVNRPIGVSEYELTRALPRQLKSSLPTVQEIEAELSSPRSKKRRKS